MRKSNQDTTPIKWPISTDEAIQLQYKTVEKLRISVNKTIELNNNVKMKFILIPPGIFMMGSTISPEEVEQKFGGISKHYNHEHPRHMVRISKPFYLGATEVTLDQFSVFIQNTGYQTEAEKEGFSIIWSKKWAKKLGATWKNVGFEQSGDHPVVNVSWNDVVEFCKWLSLKVNARCRLPTEAEWEYACRAGTGGCFQWGNNPDDGRGWSNAADLTAKKMHKNWDCFNWDDGYVYTSPVASFRPNTWGLYDMHGNVWEWVRDIYSSNYYESGHILDPQGHSSGNRHVLRGGSWFRGPKSCRSAVRNGRNASGRSYMTGFRVVMVSPDLEQSPAGPYGEEDNLLNIPQNK